MDTKVTMYKQYNSTQECEITPKTTPLLIDLKNQMYQKVSTAHSSPRGEQLQPFQRAFAVTHDDSPHNLSLTSHSLLATASSLALAPTSCTAQQEK